MRFINSSHRRLLVAFVASLALSVRLFADGPCEYDLPNVEENIRLTNLPGRTNPLDAVVFLPLFGPDDQGDATFFPTWYGSAMEPCPCVGPTNCDDECYGYMIVDIPNTFSYTRTVVYDDDIGFRVSATVTVTKDHINAFYDNMYAGYTPVGDVDFSINCHGYSFGTGNWPESGEYGTSVLLRCYNAFCTPLMAELAYCDEHSMIVSGEMCEGAYEYLDDVLTHSSEKFRSSRVYENDGECPLGVLIGLPHPTSSFVLYSED